jgi:hypothetical protein
MPPSLYGRRATRLLGSAMRRSLSLHMKGKGITPSIVQELNSYRQTLATSNWLNSVGS